MSSPDRFYITANIRNNEDTFQPATYSETRKQPLLDKDVGDYTMSVFRFSISTNSIPLWVPHIETDKVKNPSSNPNQTVYRISITDEDGVSLWTSSIQWRPQLTGENQPSFSNPMQFVPYYYMYSVQHFVDLFNETIQNALSADITSVPVLLFKDGKFSLVANPDYDEENSGQKFKLVLNEALNELMTGFPMERMDIQDDDLYASILFKTLGTNVLFDDGSSVGKYEPQAYFEGNPTGDYRLMMTQERGSLVQFQIFRGIVFTSSSLPVRSEAISQKSAYGQSTNTVQNSGSGTESLLVDMDCVLDDTETVNQQVLQYQPHILHEIDFLDTHSVDRIQFNLYWKDNYSNLRPLYLRHGSVSVKFLFKKRK